MLAGLLGLAVSSVFAGAALYINAVEQPARLHLDNRALLAEWKPAYKRGFAMQAPLAIAAFLLGVLAWWTTSDRLFALGGVLMLANWPWTLFAIMPTNTRLMNTAPGSADAATRALLMKWNRLHAIRTALGVAGALCFLIALAD